MGLLDDYSGIGMTPRPRAEHQDIILNICYGLKDDGFFCRPEFCVDSQDLNSPAPDIVVYDDDLRYPVVIIEITTHKELKTIISKVKDLMDDYPQIKESFVYDYEKEIWHCHGEDLQGDEPSYSHLLNLDLSDYL